MFCKNKMAVSSGVLPARKDALNRLETALRKFPPLLERTFISCSDEEKVLEGNFSEFRVMQWNILADGKSCQVCGRFVHKGSIIK